MQTNNDKHKAERVIWGLVQILDKTGVTYDPDDPDLNFKIGSSAPWGDVETFMMMMFFVG